MTPVIVIGVGSPFGVDRLGWDIIHLLNERDDLRELIDDKLTLLTSDRPGTKLIEIMKGADKAIIIDIIQSGMEPGSVVHLNEDDVQNAPQQVSVHGFGVADVIMLGDKMGDLPPHLSIIGLEMGQGTDWTPSHVQKNRLVDTIVNEIKDYLASLAE
jgi:hydrogenase maturation protease